MLSPGPIRTIGRFSERTVRFQPSLIIPALSEEATIATVIDRIPWALPQNDGRQQTLGSRATVKRKNDRRVV